jgi:translation initiation factor IF-1
VNGQKVKLPFNYKAAINGKNSEQDIELQPGDVIVVP